MRVLMPIGGSHPGDNTFRELIGVWAELGLVQVEPSPDDCCWAIAHGAVLLFDYDRLDDRPIPPFGVGLFGNTVPEHPRCRAWTFWARHPRQLELARLRGIRPFEQRDVRSAFLGKIENGVQQANRTAADWARVIDVFSCPVHPAPGGYALAHTDYLDLLGRTRFGLALPGYGPKCNREIELLGMGVVPILTPGVDTTYAEPLVEGVHFLRVEGPEEIPDLIRGTDAASWTALHQEGRAWYERNAAPEAAFRLTARLVEEALDELRAVSA